MQMSLTLVFSDDLSDFNVERGEGERGVEGFSYDRPGCGLLRPAGVYTADPVEEGPWEWLGLTFQEAE